MVVAGRTRVRARPSAAARRSDRGQSPRLLLLNFTDVLLARTEDPLLVDKALPVRVHPVGLDDLDVHLHAGQELLTVLVRAAPRRERGGRQRSQGRVGGQQARAAKKTGSGSST